MHAFTLATGFLAALASAAPAATSARQDSGEDITITNFLVRKYNQDNGTKTINVVDFKLSGDDATDLSCSASNPEFPNPNNVNTCSDSKYSFSLHPGLTDDVEFSLRVYHELGTAFGYWGYSDVPTVCRAGGNGAGDYVCTRSGETSIRISSSPPPINP
jgi:hypothetical protein